MKIASWNVNGIRSVWEKGFQAWLAEEKFDAVCVQEIKAEPSQLDEGLLHPNKMHSYWHPAEKKGYSGVAIYSKKEPLSLQYGIGVPEIDREGRVLIAEYPDTILISSYFPNSQRDHARLDYKIFFCEKIHEYLEFLRKNGKNLILCGDINIAHKEIDLKNPKQNIKNAGFLPQERAWLDKFLEKDYVDGFRMFNQQPDQYTWWSYRPTIRERNIGWRLDYFFANSEFKDRIKKVEHRYLVLGSDHCPITLQLKN